MFCTKCGSKLNENSDFCTNCGVKTNNDSIIEKPKKRETNFKIPFIIVTVILIILTSFFAFIITMFILFSIEEDDTTNNNYNPNYANLEYGQQNIVFKAPSGFKLDEETATDNDQTFYDSDYNYIEYILNYNYNNYYEIQKYVNSNFYNKEYKNVKINEYNATVEGQNVKTYYIEYDYDNTIYRDTFVYYPISKDYMVEIIISGRNINQNNLNNYIKTDNILISEM